MTLQDSTATAARRRPYRACVTSAPTPPTVRSANHDELPAAARVLAAAFADDPVWEWLTPHMSEFATRSVPFFAKEVASKHRAHGQVLVDDQLRGVAVWSEPNHWKGTTAEVVAMVRPALHLFGPRLPRGLRTITSMEKVHPRAPEHWYLALLGTHPDHQGSGVGSALVRAVLDRCDEQGLGAYLESSKERNVPFYARHGFEVTARHDLPGGGPPVWLMWRDPR